MEIVTDRDKVIDAFAGWVMSKGIPFRYCVTLSLIENEKRREMLEYDLRKFYNRLNDWLSGDRDWLKLEKKGKYQRLRTVTVIENGHGAKRMHAHCAIAFPSRLWKWQVEMLVKECWEHTQLGKGASIDVQETYDQRGWLEYIGKEFTARDCDAWDEQNSYLGKTKKAS